MGFVDDFLYSKEQAWFRFRQFPKQQKKFITVFYIVVGFAIGFIFQKILGLIL